MVFSSEATNLVGGDTNGMDDVFLHDMATSGTERVSVAGYGTEGAGNSLESDLSEDGRYVGFLS
ncbi:MAG: hypothetical protein GTO22_10595, partial [Gemmatimonadales bacterium]|nr:hypothetical protein [Gemmatimonadales bacterium]